MKEGRVWKIAQVNFTVPIPNALMKKVKDLLDAYLKVEAEKGREVRKP